MRRRCARCLLQAGFSEYRRRTVFSTEYFRDRYEATAQDNLRRILADLAAKGHVAAR